MRVFLDNASTHPVSNTAREAFVAALDATGNPNSVHAAGQASRALVEDARDQVAAATGAHRSEVIFTSGGTEANNLAIKGLFWHSGKKLIISSPLEHHAVLDPIIWLVEYQGAELYQLSFDRSGNFDPSELEQLLAERASEVALIALMSVNNETGVITDLDPVLELAGKYQIPVHSDAVAALGHIPIEFSNSGLASMAISGHKIGSPIGVGALLVARSVKFEALQHGGAGERELRSGTLSHPLIASIGAACTEVAPGVTDPKLAQLRDDFEVAIKQAIPEVILTSAGLKRTGHIAHLLFPNAQSDSMLYLLDQEGISVSAGSACSAGVLAPSHVLTGMGIDEQLADCSIRVSLGAETTSEDLTAFVAAASRAYPIAKLQGANQKAK